jgi:hypothetical protein
MLRIKSTIYLTGQANLNNRNSKFKTDRMTARHSISDRNVLVIGICNFDIACPVK